MKKIIFGIFVLLLGILFFSKKNADREVLAQDFREKAESSDSVSNNQKTLNQPAQADRKKVEAVEEPKREVSAAPQVAGEIQDSSLIEKAQTHLLEFDLSEDQISEMEENLSDLQKEVSFFRDNTGWIVRFHTEDNLLSRVGIKDNDLIRFGQIEKLKQDPRKTALISRLEAVIETLQR